MNSPEAQNNLSGWFDKTTDKVRGDADWIESEYFLPWRDRGAHAFRTHPIAFSFLVVFTALAILPALSFLGFSVISTTVVTLAAVGSSLFVSATLVISAACVLFGVLIVQLVIASCITLAGLGLYLFSRLIFHLRDPAGRGVPGWREEVLAFAPTIHQAQVSATSHKPSDSDWSPEPRPDEGIEPIGTEAPATL
ncbi:hypothetical protein BKA62DRAFT_829961 [Auriculariales sp. MPI-PUGE-AT-0066]|nr:hypothetical protein BKA62DRAFT_829961 [Auriculariales sp. MPI-PUGE-AT-0066]